MNLNKSWTFCGGESLECTSSLLDAGSSWKEQGDNNFESGWYTKDVTIPLEWRGRDVKLISSGVGDEYDLFINGNLVSHHGFYPSQSVSKLTTQTQIESFLHFGTTNIITIYVRSWNSIGGLTGSISLKSTIPFKEIKPQLPTPLLENNKKYINLYWSAWEKVWERACSGANANGFSSVFTGEAFNKDAFMRDCVLAKYGNAVFPVMEFLNCLYSNQGDNGYIHHEIIDKKSRTSLAGEPLTNFSLFAWVEWSYYEFSGDKNRLNKAYPILVNYYNWLECNTKRQGGDGLYCQARLDRGIGSTLRNDSQLGSWIDPSMQMAVFAKYLKKIACELNYSEFTEHQLNYLKIKKQINELLWHHDDGFYYDRTSEGKLTGIKHIGAFWGFLSEVPSEIQNEHLLKSLTNPEELFRYHLFPTLPSSDPKYCPQSYYRSGGDLATISYMVIKGLAEIGQFELARQSAMSHLDNISVVYQLEQHISELEKDREYYLRQESFRSPESSLIALLIEDVLGIKVYGTKKQIEWRPLPQQINGIKNIQIGSGTASFFYNPAKKSIMITSNTEFELRLYVPGTGKLLKIRQKPGMTLTSI